MHITSFVAIWEHYLWVCSEKKRGDRQWKGSSQLLLPESGFLSSAGTWPLSPGEIKALARIDLCWLMHTLALCISTYIYIDTALFI
jgi:hypothetical protein